MTLIELGASSEAGIFNEAEESRRVVEANQKTLRDSVSIATVIR